MFEVQQLKSSKPPMQTGSAGVTEDKLTLTKQQMENEKKAITPRHRVEWPDIITYSWAPKRQNLNANVIRMVKNKREKAPICLEGMDKTRFPDFPKSHLMFWTTGFSWGMLYLQLQPKNGKFYEGFALSFCVAKLGTNRLFQRETCSRYEVRSDFLVSEAGFKKVNDGK